MAQYRNLNAPPPRMFAEIVADMNNRDRQSKTGDAGVKDLGESGDVVWPREDGEVASIRDVDLELADARQRIEDAEGALKGARDRIDTALDAEGHIREDEILRNATLLGETVVEQINITDKLVGTDGVFTGTVDFANVNVTGELLANEISGEHIYGTVIEGGEIRTGDDESRGSFLLGDRAFVSPVGGAESPGLRFTPANTAMTRPPGVGIDGSYLTLSGGRRPDGRTSRIDVGYGILAELRAPVAGGEQFSQLSVNPESANLLSRHSNGSQATEISVRSGENVGGVYLQSQAQLRVYSGGQNRIIAARESGEVLMQSGGRTLSVDDSGVWVKTNKSGTQQAWNLEETASDTGWFPIALRSGFSAQPGYSPEVRRIGPVVYLRGGVNGAALTATNTSYIVGDIPGTPSGLRPPDRDIYMMGVSSQANFAPLVVLHTSGAITVRTAAVLGGYYLFDPINFPD